MFNNYKVVVMGAYGILGDMLVRAFLDDGATVISINDEKQSIVSNNYYFLEHDFKKIDETRHLRDIIEEYFEGTLDIFINVANIQKDIDLRLVTKREFDDYFGTSLFTSIAMNRELYPMLLKAESGNPSVINIGSALSRSNDIESGVACLYSQAIIKLTRMQARSYNGVRCNSVSPVKIQSVEDCHDILNAILFLCSTEAGFITGSDFLIDYGESAKNGARLEK